MNEVELINTVRDNLAAVFPGNGAAPPPVTANSLAASKPDRNWLIGQVAGNLRVPAGLTGYNLRLQTGELQQIDPVTLRPNVAAQRPTIPIRMTAAAATARANTTARERVDEMFKSLTRAEQPTAIGTPPYANLNDIRTFTMYVHYYLADMGTHTQDWEISRRHTRRLESLFNAVTVGANPRAGAANWPLVQQHLHDDGLPGGRNTMHYVLVTRYKNPKYGAAYEYIFDASSVFPGANDYRNPGGPCIGNGFTQAWTVVRTAGTETLITPAVWAQMTAGAPTFELYAINPFGPPQPMRPTAEIDAHRLAGGRQLGPLRFGAMAPSFVNLANAGGARIVASNQRPLASQARNAPRDGVTRSTRSMRQVLRQGGPEGRFGRVDTVPISTRPRPFAI